MNSKLYISNNLSETRGMVFNIQRFSLQDGPGIRTSVFLKGCPCNCIWCCNPESQKLEKELMHYEEKCIQCLQCIENCPVSAISVKNKKINIDRKLCNLCKNCVEVCPQGAYSVVGEEMGVDTVIQEVLRDIPFYNKSGGGVTLTGGEPSYQSEFASLILKAAKGEHVDTAIETSGYARWEKLKTILRFTDLVLFDLKIMSENDSQELIGVKSSIILQNLKKIDALGLRLIIRMPLIPGYNDSDRNLEEMVNYLKNLKRAYPIEIIPFHQHGRFKYKALGRNYSLQEKSSLHNNDAEVERVKNVFKNNGFKVKIL